MAGYWWQCTKSSKQVDFEEVVNQGIVSFFWDVLSLQWDQSLLTQTCLSCREKSLRITYKFPREKEETISVIHIVGLRDADEEYLPMLWEGMPHSNPESSWFDFKYLGDRRKRGANLGLSRPAVLSQVELASLLQLYVDKTGKSLVA
jgi:hypothetical protein